MITNVLIQCGMLIMGKAVHILGQGIHKNAVFSVQFCCEFKTSLKNRMDRLIHTYIHRGI